MKSPVAVGVSGNSSFHLSGFGDWGSGERVSHHVARCTEVPITLIGSFERGRRVWMTTTKTTKVRIVQGLGADCSARRIAAASNWAVVVVVRRLTSLYIGVEAQRFCS